MNMFVILAIIVGVLLLGGLAIISIQTTQAQDQVQNQGNSCDYSAACPYGGKCNAERNCGLSTCGVAKTGSCGCGR